MFINKDRIRIIMFIKDIIILTLLSAIPFLVFFFLTDISIIYYILLIILFLIVGSIFPYVNMKNKLFFFIIQKPTELIVNILNLNNQKLDSDKLAHSPIGAIISSLISTFYISLVLFFLSRFNYISSTIIFFSILIGQFMHLINDSFTSKGIDWGYPFISNIVRGNLTISKKEFFIDIRIIFFEIILILFSISIFLNNYYKILIFDTKYSQFLAIESILFILWFLFSIISGVFFSDKEERKHFLIKIKTKKKNVEQLLNSRPSEIIKGKDEKIKDPKPKKKLNLDWSKIEKY